MGRKVYILLLVLCMALLLSGCGMKTVDQLYCLPERSDADSDLQKVIDKAMQGMEYAPPRGDNRQVTQRVDLDGDGIDECLVFAREKSTRDLKILVIGQLASGYVLMDTIEGNCTAFDAVSYAQLDGQPGMEIIVGRQLSNEVTRSLTVYRFSSEQVHEILQESYERLLVCNYGADENWELLLISEAATKDDSAVISLYALVEHQLQCTAVTALSQDIQRVRRAVLGKLSGDRQAIFISGLTAENALVTDIYGMTDEGLENICTTEPMQALGNQYLYPEDLDADGILELPELVSMPLHPEQTQQQYFVRWYALDEQAVRTEKMFTYMNLTGLWYMTMDSRWADQLSVVHSSTESVFYLWDAGHKIAQKLVTVYTVKPSEWAGLSKQEEYILLYGGDAVVYAAQLGPAAQNIGITEETLRASFYMMLTERNTEES